MSHRLCSIAVAIGLAVTIAGPPGAAATGAVTSSHHGHPVPAGERRLRLFTVITGSITPKSVAATGTGLVFAQNMIYRHSITVYDRRGRLVNIIPDSIRLARFGFPQFPGVSRGGPVEAAFSPDHRFAYVSNHSMYGPSFDHPGSDSCSPASGIDRSFVYRIGLEHLLLRGAIEVGEVPKVVATTPDGRVVARVHTGTEPRSMAIAPDGSALFVVNYDSDTASVVRTRDMRVVQTVRTNVHPVGVTYEGASHRVWVACYSGSIMVFDDAVPR